MSDQDFFFDEDDKSSKTAAKPAAKKTGSSPSRSTSSAPAPATAQSVSMTIAVLIGVIGILLGAVIGLFVGKSMATPAVVVPSATTTQQAPQLTPEQLQGGQLPAGHPSIGGAGAATAAPAPKK